MATREPGENLEQLLRRQHQLLTRKQALQFMTKAALAWRLGAGARYQVILPGVYGAFTGTPTDVQHLSAALLYAGDEAFITGASGCRWYWLKKTSNDGLVWVATTRRHLAGVGRVRFVRTHRAAALTNFKRIRVALAARCVVDACLEMTDLDGVRALVAESIMRKKATVEELVLEAKRAPKRGSKLLRQALGDIVAGARSAAEAKNVRLTKSSKVLPELHYNCSLMGPKGFIAMPDAYAEESGVAQEIDSVEYHIYADLWKATQKRRARMVRFGIAALEMAPSRVDDDPAGVLRDYEGAHLIGLRTGPPPGIWVRCRDDCPLRNRPRILAAA
ncbi:MAG: hypothetical protein QOG53_1861 [Frankiales bacterium]|jgi:hypothetical protein|nr:hypothetical protein [Frankiales bacterium]